MSTAKTKPKTKTIGKNKPPKEPAKKPKRSIVRSSSKSAGRPSLFTPELQRLILTALRAGNYMNTVADAVGIGVATIHEWIARGEGRDPDRPQTPEFAEFAAEVKKALSLGEIAAIDRLQKAARGNVLRERTTVKRGNETETTEKYYPPVWQADAWFLERRYPDRWGRRERHEVVSPGSDRLEVGMTAGLSSDLMAVIAKIYGEDADASSSDAVPQQ